MYIHNIDPVLFSIGPAEIRWYGLVYVIGFLGTLILLLQLQKKGHLNLTKDDVYDLMIYSMLGVVIGSRLFMIFWSPAYYLSNPWNFFKIWEGGMSFHGGFAGILLAVYLYARKKRISFLNLADVFAAPTMIALALGRLANFINGELWGTVTTPQSVPWCVNFKNTGGGDFCRHPQQLYAASYRILIGIYLLFLSMRDKFKAGFLFLNFMLLEGLGRFIVDFWREDPRFLLLSLGQWFSVIMVVISAYLLVCSYRGEWKKMWS